jgi:hypothetical protein
LAKANSGRSLATTPHHTGTIRRASNTNSIFADESGDPGLEITSKLSYYVIGFVFCREPFKLQLELRRYLRYLHYKKRYPSELRELKFTLPYGWLSKRGYTYQQLDDEYSPELPGIRTEAIRIVNENCEGVFATVLDKTKAFQGLNPPPSLIKIREIEIISASRKPSVLRTYMNYF